MSVIGSGVIGLAKKLPSTVPIPLLGVLVPPQEASRVNSGRKPGDGGFRDGLALFKP